MLFSHWTVSHSLWPFRQQHIRLSCPWLSPGGCSDSCPLNQWCYLTTVLWCVKYTIHALKLVTIPLEPMLPIGQQMKKWKWKWSHSVVSESVWPYRQQPTKPPRPWDSPGKNTGVGCHFLLQCMKVKSESEVAQACLTLSDPMDCSPPGSSIHGIFQARVLEGGAIAFSEQMKKTATKNTDSKETLKYHKRRCKGWKESESRRTYPV